MKNVRFLFFLFLQGLTCGFCEDFSPCEKNYVHPSQIHIEPNGIFIHVYGRWFKTEALYMDAGGPYFTNALQDDWSIYWKCPRCGFLNGPLDNRCKNPNCPSK